MGGFRGVGLVHIVGVRGCAYTQTRWGTTVLMVGVGGCESTGPAAFIHVHSCRTRQHHTPQHHTQIHVEVVNTTRYNAILRFTTSTAGSEYGINVWC